MLDCWWPVFQHDGISTSCCFADIIRRALLSRNSVESGDEHIQQWQDSWSTSLQHGQLERRVAADGYPYTRQDFVDFYGSEEWKLQWDNSPLATASTSPLATASTSEAEASCESESGRSTSSAGVWSTSYDEQGLNNMQGICGQCGSLRECLDGRGVFRAVMYCQECWAEWYNAEMYRELTPSSVEMRRDVGSGHFDFIEVGTSDWCTISQFCAGDSRGSGIGVEIRTSLEDLRQVRGIAVEAVGEHLAALPPLPRVVQVEAAMGEVSGEDILYYVSAENIARHMGEFRANLHIEVDVMWYAKSMSSVGKPHPQLEHLLREVDRLDFLEQRPVKILSWGDLCALHGVASVDVVQLDCEGMDCSVLRGLITHCGKHPNAFPRLIVFEANCLTDPDEVEQTVQALKDHGYRLRTQTWENITVERG